MEAIRRYVFPVIWMIITGLIALALVKMAFFGGDRAQADGDGASPAATVDQYATVPVAKGDITSRLELSATVQSDPGTTLKSSRAGEIVKVWVIDGDHVEEGDKILQVRVPREDAAAPAAPADPNAAAPAAPSYRYLNVTATEDGTVEDLSAMKGQTLAVGDPVATLSPGTHAIVAPLTPDQQLQLMDQQIKASATLPSAAEPVPCQAPEIDDDKPADAQQTAPQDGAPQDPGMPMDPAAGDGTGSASASAASLRCPVPAGTKIVPGLSVDVVVDLGAAKGVLTAPTTAVEGTGTHGAVYVLDPSTGEPTKKAVTIGKRGEKTVEISGGVAEGQEILQFVPGVKNTDDTAPEEW